MPSLFLRTVAPLARIVPSVKKPERDPGFRTKLIWTIVAVVIYMIMSTVPLYGIEREAGVDIFWTLRVILASTRGTLAELGIGPIVTGGLILEILVGSKMINVDLTDPAERQLFNAANKAMAVIMTIFESAAYIIGGAYGSLKPGQALLVFIQLLFAGIVIILLDEMVQKGWGFGSGISLFIVAGVAGRIAWSLFSVSISDDNLFYGIIPALIQTLTDKDRSFREIILRYNAPDLVGLLTTIGIAIIIIYLEAMTIEIPVESSIYRFRFRYPIKFMYSSNVPVILAGALFANIMFFSQLIWSKFEGNFFASLLGSWIVENGRPIPTGGLAYFTVPPQGLLWSVQHYYQAIGYIILMTISCYFFSITWVEIAGIGPDRIAEQLLASNLSIPGVRRTKSHMARYLDPYIRTAASLSGVLIGLVAGIADVLGAYASGSGILLAVSILKSLYEEIATKYAEEMTPFFKRVFLGPLAR
ncbi:MAG: preprotein translocase subunit SecY [Candidatus Njordarchaeales archaeon]